jgi:hypothetical protein
MSAAVSFFPPGFISAPRRNYLGTSPYTGLGSKGIKYRMTAEVLMIRRPDCLDRRVKIR